MPVKFIWNMLLTITLHGQMRHVFSTPIINLDPELYSIFLSAFMDSTSVTDACKSLTKVKHQGGLAILSLLGAQFL